MRGFREIATIREIVVISVVFVMLFLRIALVMMIRMDLVNYSEPFKQGM